MDGHHAPGWGGGLCKFAVQSIGNVNKVEEAHFSREQQANNTLDWCHYSYLGVGGADTQLTEATRSIGS